MTVLYVMRHGESESNALHVYGGQADYPLTENGRRQAEALGEKLKSYHFDRVYCSDLTRAKETCAIALKDAAPIYTPLIREHDVGSMSGKTYADYSGDAAFLSARANRDFSAFDGESYEHIAARAQEFLDLVAESGCESVAAFAHGGFLNVLLNCVTGLRIQAGTFLSPNCAVTAFRYSDDGRWQVLGWNI